MGRESTHPQNIPVQSFQKIYLFNATPIEARNMVAHKRATARYKHGRMVSLTQVTPDAKASESHENGCSLDDHLMSINAGVDPSATPGRERYVQKTHVPMFDPVKSEVRLGCLKTVLARDIEFSCGANAFISVQPCTALKAMAAHA